MRPTSVGRLAGRRPRAGRSWPASRDPRRVPCDQRRGADRRRPRSRSIPFRLAPTRPIITSPAENRNLRHAHDAGHARAGAVFDVVGLGSVDVGVAVGLHDEVRVQRQHLVLELALEAARHAEHDDQRRDAQHDAHRRHRREHREDAQQERPPPTTSPPTSTPMTPTVSSGARMAVRASEDARSRRRPAPSAGHERRPAPSGPPAAVQVAEADQALEPQLEQLAEHPAEAERRRSRSNATACRRQLRPGREARTPPATRGRRVQRRECAADGSW